MFRGSESGAYRLVVLRRLCRGGGRRRHGHRGGCSGLRHHGGLDRGVRVSRQAGSLLGLRLRSSLGLSCRSRLMTQSTTQTVTQLLHGDLDGPDKTWVSV